MGVINSASMSIGLATEGLDDLSFDLWTRLYGFIVKDVEKAVFKLDYAAREVMKVMK